MILVRDILSAPLFSNFRIVSGYNGLNTPVRTTGFWEWESPADTRKNFSKGAFIVTTLAAVKDDPGEAESCLRDLIRNQAAAIAIKDVYYKEVSEQLRAFSDEWNVPILFFSDTYIDYIIFYIMTALKKEDSAAQEKIIKEMLSDASLPPEQCREYAQKLNPFFEPELLFCAYVSVSGTDSETQVRKPLHFDTFGNFETRTAGAWTKRRTDTSLPPLKYSFLPFEQGTFLICTTKEPAAFPADFPLEFVKSFFPDFGNEHRVGLCTESGTLEDLAQRMKKAFYANISCTIDEVTALDFTQTGVDQLLCPVSSGDWSRAFYQALLERLSTAGDNPEVLISTLDTYCKCGGDVPLTAKVTYQHSNTIRYRLQKIRKAWDARDDISFDSQAMLFCRLHHIHQLM